MAQLSDDCFAFGGPMMSVDEAVGIIAARVTPVKEIETVALKEADGRILAGDISAPLPLPPFTNSAVDGYAVRSRDLPQAGGSGLRRDRPRSGRRSAADDRSSRARRCASSPARRCPMAPTPCSCRRTCALDGEGRVVLPAGLKPGANVRPAGEDIPVGTAALASRPAAAAAGCRAGGRLRPDAIDVTRRIRVAVFSTGNELVSPGEPRAGRRNCSIPTASC